MVSTPVIITSPLRNTSATSPPNKPHTCMHTPQAHRHHQNCTTQSHPPPPTPPSAAPRSHKKTTRNDKHPKHHAPSPKKIPSRHAHSQKATKKLGPPLIPSTVHPVCTTTHTRKPLAGEHPPRHSTQFPNPRIARRPRQSRLISPAYTLTPEIEFTVTAKDG